MLTLRKRIFIQCIKKTKRFQKGTTYKIQQAISKAINTTGPSIVTVCIEYPNSPPPPVPPHPKTPLQSSPPTPTRVNLPPLGKQRQKKKDKTDNAMEQCILTQ